MQQHDEKRSPIETLKDDTLLLASGLYAIVAGFAITAAIEGLLKLPSATVIYPNGTALTPNPNIIQPLELVKQTSTTFVFLSFILFAIPFYHGAVVSLSRTIRSAAPGFAPRTTVDFIALFLEAGILYALALAITSYRIFLSWLLVLNAVDLAWILLAHTPHFHREKPLMARTFRNWAILDAAVILYVVAFRIVLPLRILSGEEGIGLFLLLVGISAVRTSVDYISNLEAYFGKKRERASQASDRSSVLAGSSRC